MVPFYVPRSTAQSRIAETTAEKSILLLPVTAVIHDKFLNSVIAGVQTCL